MANAWDSFWSDPIKGVSNFVDDLTGVTAANTAADAANKGAQAAIDNTQELLSPYTQAGEQSIEMQQALSGALGPEAQQAAIDQIQNSPGFQASIQQGENSMLQNASATGGLRGGNTQGALAQFRPQMLNQAIDQRYNQLSGLSALGANAAGGQASQVGGYMNQMGQTDASNALAKYNLQRDAWGDVINFGKETASFAGGGGFSGGGSGNWWQ